MGTDRSADLIYLLMLLAFIGLAVFGHYREQLGRGLRHALIWASVFAALFVGYALWQNRNSSSPLTDDLKAEFDPAGGIEHNHSLILTEGEDGHHWLRAEVNGHSILFMIDTGASDIVLSPKDAQKLGFTADRLKFTRLYSTANGSVWGAPVRLKQLKAGPILLHDLPASVNGAEMEHSLLGQGFLKRLSGYAVTGRRMTLQP